MVYLSLGGSKISTILLVRRLFIRDMKTAWSTCNTVVGIMVTWTVGSAIMVSARCPAESLIPQTSSGLCAGLKTRYMLVIVADGVTDLVLAILPAYLCRHLHMRFMFKLQVLGIFALRLPLLVLTGLFYKNWIASLAGDATDVIRTKALVFQQAEVCLSIIAGTIPCLKSFIQSFDTGSGVKAGFGSTHTSGYGRFSKAHHGSNADINNEESHQMSPLSRGKNDRQVYQVKHDENESHRYDKGSATGIYGVSPEDLVHSEPRSTLDLDRSSQLSTQELVIRKDIRSGVTREVARKEA